MEFKTSNLGKPRDKRWKNVLRILILLLPAYMGVIVGTDLISGEAKSWSIFALSMLIATVQALSEFTAEPETPKTDV